MHRLLILPLLALPLAPAIAAGPWDEEIRTEAADQGCEVASIDGGGQHFVDGRAVVAAKVRCGDGRIMSARRPDEGLPFEFKPCGDAADAC